jgi:hypothetical protein
LAGTGFSGAAVERVADADVDRDAAGNFDVPVADLDGVVVLRRIVDRFGKRLDDAMVTGDARKLFLRLDGARRQQGCGRAMDKGNLVDTHHSANIAGPAA